MFNIDDAHARRGARLVDAHCTDTTMRDYLCGADLAHVPDEMVTMYDDETARQDGRLHQPSVA